MQWGSLTARLVIATAVWIVVLLGIGGAVISEVFESYLTRNFDARLTQYVESLIGASQIDEDGQIRFTRPLGEQAFFEPYSGWYWQVDAAGSPPFRSRSLWDQTLVLDHSQPAFEQRIDRHEGPAGQILRVAERDVYLPESDTLFRYAVAGDIRELEDQIRRFRRALFWSLAVLGIGLIAALLIQVSYGLRPLRTVRRELAAIRSGQQSQLGDDFPPEITPLVDELNALIDHNTDLVNRARTHAGNLAHALKTPLSVLSNEARDTQGPLAEVVDKQTRTMRRHIDHHLTRARAAGGTQTIGARTVIGPVIDALIRALDRIHAERDLSFQFAGDSRLAFKGARQDLDEMLGNLMDNAAKWARSKIRISAARTPVGQAPARLFLTVEDDGPGIPEAQWSHVFGRGRRADENVPGSGLGLSIVQDFANLCGGTIDLGRSDDLGGLKVVLELPLAGA